MTQWFISSLFSSCRMAFPSVYIVNVYFLSHWIWAGTSLLALMLQSETAGTMTRLKSFSRRWKCAQSRLCGGIFLGGFSRPVDDNHTGMRNPIIHTEMKSWEHKTPGLEDITQQSPSFFAPLADNRLPPFIHSFSSLFLPRKKERLKIREREKLTCSPYNTQPVLYNQKCPHRVYLMLIAKVNLTEITKRDRKVNPFLFFFF